MVFIQFHVDNCILDDECNCGEYEDTRMREAEKTGSRLTILKTMRVMLAERFDGASTRESAALSRQLQNVCDQIIELEGATNAKSDPLAESAERWAARMADATDIHTPTV